MSVYRSPSPESEDGFTAKLLKLKIGSAIQGPTNPHLRPITVVDRGAHGRYECWGPNGCSEVQPVIAIVPANLDDRLQAVKTWFRDVLRYHISRWSGSEGRIDGHYPHKESFVLQLR